VDKVEFRNRLIGMSMPGVSVDDAIKQDWWSVLFKELYADPVVVFATFS